MKGKAKATPLRTQASAQPLPSPKPAPPTLAQFIEDNHKLITVFGVFTALTVFAAGLPVRAVGTMLSFMFITLAVFVWMELWTRFPSNGGSWRLTWFENLLSLTVLILLAYWLLDFRPLWQYFLVVLLFLVFLGITSGILKRLNVFNRLFRTEPGQRRGLRFAFGIAIFLFVAYVSLQLAGLVTPPVNRWLDTISSALSTPIP
jgi:hypothetical protein